MLLLTQRLTSITDVVPDLTLSLTAEERTRSRYRLTTPEGEEIGLHLPRGTVLQEGDLLTSEDGKTIVRIVARSEPTILVTATHSLDLLRAAYHLGNRHVPLEITPNYLRLSPDPVLESMLIKLGLVIREEIAPFHPEIGAYHGH
jgi:urease accessory protein